MNTLSVSRLALALAFGVTLSACSSTPPDQIPSDQTAPGTASRPILSANEAKNFVAARYFASLTPNTAPWSPSPITLPAQPDFVVGPAGTPGVTHIEGGVDMVSDGDKVQINKVNILGRQNTFFVTNSGVQNRLQTDRQPAYAGDEQLY